MTKKIKILSITAIVIVLLAGICPAEEDVVTRINRCFENKQFTQGLNILEKALNERKELKPELLLMKASFYENYAGNLLQANRFYRQILQLNLPSDQKYMIEAQAGIKRIEEYSQKFAVEIELFKEIEKRAKKDTELKQLNARLLEIISSNNNELLLANAYYHLANVYLDQKIYWPAYQALFKVLELKPAFNYYLPVNTLQYDAYNQWLLNLIADIAWTVLLALLIFISIVFYLSRPWQWLNIKIAASAIIIILLFAAFGLFVMWIINKTAAPPPDYMSPPVYYRANFGGFNAWLPVKSSLYILTAFVGVIILVISTLRFKHRWTWRLINIFAAILLFSSLFTVLFLRYGYDSSSYSINSFYREKNKTFSFFSGRTYFRLRDVRPFVLTNPKAYHDLGTKKMDEPVFARWLDKIKENIETPDESTEPKQ